MYVTQLTILNFRNHPEVSLSPGKGMNVLLGRNAQGKTSILEAIYAAATTRSWRAGKDAELIAFGQDQARVHMAVTREAQNDVELELRLSTTEKKSITVNTIRQTRVADLIGQVKVLLIEPEDGEIVRGEPSARRKFLNLEISQIQPIYCHLLSSYRKVLEQRNRILKDMQKGLTGGGVLDILNEQLVTYGSGLVQRRLQFVQRINDLATEIHSGITDGSEKLEIRYVSSTDLNGTDTAEEITLRLKARLAEVRAEEIRRGVTLVGPQRDELTFHLNGLDARVYGSHGQQRTIALSLRLAEFAVMEESAMEPPIVLLDDVMTDLDEERRGHVLALTQGRCQTFITAPSDRAFTPEMLPGAKIYRLADGKVMEQ